MLHLREPLNHLTPAFSKYNDNPQKAKAELRKARADATSAQEEVDRLKSTLLEVNQKREEDRQTIDNLKKQLKG